jgi:phosphoribosylaminoimidazole-succinocarboxamide synthase
MTRNAITRIEIPGVKHFRQGKVRDIFCVDDGLILAATDRISAFDVVMNEGISDKGRILTGMSAFWFNQIAEAWPHHVITTDVTQFPEPFNHYPEQLGGRSMFVRKTNPLPVECVVRGYLAGSAWVEYQRGIPVGGNRLPPGLRESERLPDVIFSPATKSTEGHDINITFDQAVQMLGGPLAEQVRDRALAIYRKGAELAEARGIIIADTKFEFGRTEDDVLLIDEILTPDSSRFWPADEYEPGRPQHAFDKQFLRDYLISIRWDRNPPPPPLPTEVVTKTRIRYLEAYRRLTGRDLPME